jgi:hypothetical protein
MSKTSIKIGFENQGSVPTPRWKYLSRPKMRAMLNQPAIA